MKVASMDLSNNDIGDRGVVMIAKWIRGTADDNTESSNDESSSSSTPSCEITSELSLAEQVAR